MWLEYSIRSTIIDILFYLMMMLILVLIFKVMKYLSRDSYLHIAANDSHCWRIITHISQSCYCSNCESLLMEGYYCDSCGVCAEGRCIRKINSKFKCKKMSANEGVMKHQWVKGNVGVGTNCYVCDEECSTDPGLVDYKCTWCLRCVHTSCKLTLGEVCDFGKHKQFILPPNNIKLEYKRPRVKSSLVLRGITDPGWNEWTPLFVIGNSLSGNNKAGEILSFMRSYLNRCQVVDLSKNGPSAVVEYLVMLPENAKPNILVAGGDGSVAWILTELAAHHNIDVPVGVIPLGTGNDLSRVLGWGAKEPNDISPVKLFELIKKTKPVYLDRWSVDILGARHLRFARPFKTFYMYNYLSIGVDALVTLKFHNTRRSRFYIFSSRIINKLMYLVFGTEQVVERNCKNLEEKVEMYLDGVKADLPALESIVILNIPSWGAGVPLWTLGTGENRWEQKVDDGKLEVAGINSSFHIAQLQVGLSEPHRIGQAQQIKIIIKSRLPMQVDGEPWMQSPAEINLTFHNQASVLQLSQ